VCDKELLTRFHHPSYVRIGRAIYPRDFGLFIPVPYASNLKSSLAINKAQVLGPHAISRLIWSTLTRVDISIKRNTHPDLCRRETHLDKPPWTRCIWYPTPCAIVVVSPIAYYWIFLIVRRKQRRIESNN